MRVSCWWRPSAQLSTPCCCGNFWLCFSIFFLSSPRVFRKIKISYTYTSRLYSSITTKKRKETCAVCCSSCAFKCLPFSWRLLNWSSSWMNSSPPWPLFDHANSFLLLFYFLAAGVQVGCFIFRVKWMKGDGMFVARSTRSNAAKTWRSIQMGFRRQSRWWSYKLGE